MSGAQGLSDPGREQALLLGAEGAIGAVHALASLFGLDPPAEAPLATRVPEGRLGDLLFERGPEVEWTAAIFAELAGSVTGQLALIVSSEMVQALVERFLSEPAKPDERYDELAHSALCELGNIAISAAAGGFASIAGGTVIPSTPSILFRPSEDAPTEQLHAELNRASSLMYATALDDGTRRLPVRLLWIHS